MTSQKDQIQALITDIDGVLQKATPRLPWVVSGEMTQQRQVLERVRNYLVAVQRRQIASEGFGQAGARPDLLAHDIYYQPAQPSYPASQAAQPGQQAYGQDELNAQQMLQTIVQEMGYLRSNLMQPLQADVEVLRQQRETLVHEIRQLEAHRQGYAGQLPGQQQLIAEFLQALMSRLQETLPQQLAQTLSQQALPYAHPYANDLALPGSASAVIAASDAPAQGLGNIQVSQAPADELLIRLDSTLSVVFESLQRNVQSYQESLSQGLDKMHSMGQQGEMMFTALISHLAEQLGRETSAYLQPAATTDQESVRSTPSLTTPTSPPLPTETAPVVNPLLFSQPYTDPNAAASPPLALPFPGTEISDYLATPTTVPSVDTAIDSWLRAASSASDLPSDLPDVDLEIAALNLDRFDLSELADQDVTELLELDATLLDTDLPPQPILSPTTPIADPSVADTTGEDTADIDAALKLLEQLSSELQPPSAADADAQIDQILSGTSGLVDKSVKSGIPADARDELDEFYESLFGTDASGTDPIGTDTIATPISDTPTQAAIATPVGEPAALEPNAQPISTLPAETQLPMGTSTEAIAVGTPATSTVADPTLGWHLPSAPLATEPEATEPEVTEPVTAPAAELEIPEALLEDELLGGWDFADAEIDIVEPAPPSTQDLLGGWDLAPADDRATLPLADTALDGTETEGTAPAPLPTHDLLGGWDLASVDDRATLPLADTALEGTETEGTETEGTAPAPLPTHDLLSGWDLASVDDRPTPSLADAPTDALPATDPLAAFFDDSQPLVMDVDPVIAPAIDAPPADAQTATNQPDSRDEISALTDLFGETAFGETASAAPLESAIADPPAIPAQPVNPPADPTGWAFPDTSPDTSPMQTAPATPSANLTEGYLTDDRYTPASPDEDLLVLDEPIEALDSELWLDEGTLNRLSEDLFNLEEAIDEPATPSYSSEPGSSEPETQSPILLPDATVLADTPPPETLPTFSETTSETTALGDWSDVSLDDFAFNEVAPIVIAPAEVAATLPTTPPALFPLESESDAIAADPPGNFLLEGMDDLFANTPVEPPVMPISPPVPPATEPPASFSLTSLDDLFASSPASDPAVSAPALPVEPFTLEGVDSLFTDAPTVSPEIPSASSTSAAAPFTLEGVDDLFSETPVTETSATEAAIVPPAFVPISTPAAAPFTLEGVDDLFTEASVTEAAIVPPASVPTSNPAAAPFTLEGVDDLFTEASVTEAVIVPPASVPTSTPAAAPFTLEGVDDLFTETAIAPAASLSTSTPATEQPLPFTLDGVDELFADMPPVSAVPPLTDLAPAILPLAEELSVEPDAILSPAPTASTQPEAVTDFTLEQVGNLFVELPATAIAATPLPSVGDAAVVPPFTLEPVGDLFIEVPSGTSMLDARSTATSTPPLEPPATLSPPPFSLEQIGDLFVETPSAEAALPDVSPPISQAPATSEASALEQAFASLLGSFDEPLEPFSPLADGTEAETQAPEKKKERS